jgi:3-oxoacyl-[acyl-carrier protein] reductase
MNSLEHKVALVTGASRGIGAAVTHQLAAAGAAVVVNYAGSQRAAAQVVQAIEAASGRALAVQADVSPPAQVTRLFDEALAQFGRLDILVNNAGVIVYKLLQDLTDDDFTRLFDVNVHGTFNTLRQAATRLAEGGSSINFSTSVNRLLLPTYSGYVATKSAVEQLTRVFAKEIGPRGITVNSVSPGPTNTDFFTVGKPPEIIARLAAASAFNRIGEPADIARVVVWLASEDARWVSGQNIGVNGAMA